MRAAAPPISGNRPARTGLAKPGRILRSAKFPPATIWGAARQYRTKINIIGPILAATSSEAPRTAARRARNITNGSRTTEARPTITMATTLSARPPVQSKTSASAAAKLDSVPWYIWALFTAVVSVVIGGYWDISWHMSIGRDSFWTPAHIAIQMCGVLAGLSCGYLILSCTLDTASDLRPHTVPDLRPYTVPDLRPYTVKVWGFRGPLGA